MGDPEINLDAIPDEIAADDPRLDLRFEGMEGISFRCWNNFKIDKIVAVRDLLSPINGDPAWFHSEKSLLRLPNFGRKSMAELKEVLATRGLKIGMRIVAADTAALTPETVNSLTPEIRGQVILLAEMARHLPADNASQYAIQEELGVMPETLEALILRGLSNKPHGEHTERLKRLLARFMVMARA